MSPLTPNDVESQKIIQMNDGKTGYTGCAISPDGELVNLFNNNGIKGAGKRAVEEAIKNGANHLNCFAGFLPSYYYKQFGFKETGRHKWDDQYAQRIGNI